MNLPSSNPFLGFLTLTAQGNTKRVDVGLDEKAGDAFILQEAATKVVRHGVGEGGDVSKLFGDSEDEAENVAEPWATQRTRETMVENSKFEPKERPRAQLSIPR